MLRKTLAFTILAGLAGSAIAQPAPGDQPPPTPPPDTTTPTTPTTPPTPPPVVTVPVVVAVPEATKPEPVKKLATGTEGFLQPGILVQGWYIHDIVDGNSPLATFRLRRAEIHLKGEILPKQVAYKVMFDPAKVREFANVPVVDGNGMTQQVPEPVSKVAVLQDFEITALTKYADISIGQFKIPVSWEGFNSSAKIIMPERDPGSAKYGDIRDMGIKATKAFPMWSYFVGLYNGTTANVLDNNPGKDLALRLEAYPVKGLTLAGVTYDSIGYRGRAGTKDRWEGDVRYDNGVALVQAEFIEARDVAKNGATATASRSFYLAGGYTLKNIGRGDLQPVVRVGYLDPNTDGMTTGDAATHFDVGANYFLEGHEMKLQGSFAHTTYQQPAMGSKPALDEVILAAQVWY